MRIVLVGDVPGIPQLLRHVPRPHVVGLIGATIRPQYMGALSSISTELNVPLIIQPKISDPSYRGFLNEVESLQPDLLWVNSYSMILRGDLRDISRLGALNIHSALLPRYRGCNPLQWAILNGEWETGVTIHEVTEGLDEGPIVDQRKVDILFEDTWLTLRDRVEKATDDLIQANLASILRGEWLSQKQDEAAASKCRRRTPQDSLIEWDGSVLSIYHKIRALIPPLPPAFYLLDDGKVMVVDRVLSPMAITHLKFSPEVGKKELLSFRIQLKPFKDEDSKVLFRTTGGVVPLVGSTRVSTDNDGWGSLVESLQLTHEGAVVAFLIEVRETGESIGVCEFRKINWRDREAEIAVGLSKSPIDEGGIEDEIISLLCEFGERELLLDKVSADAASTNKAILSACGRAGFVESHKGPTKVFSPSSRATIARNG